jgi:hypothetical protein
MHLQAMIEQDWRSTWRRSRCWDSMHQLVNLQLWEYDEVTLPLSAHGELAGGGRSNRERHAAS